MLERKNIKRGFGWYRQLPPGVLNARQLFFMKSAIFFIDGNNWYHNSKVALEELGNVDFKKLAKMICSMFDLELVCVKYYNAMPNENSKSFWKHRRFIDILRGEGLIVKTKELSGVGKFVREKGIDVMITMDMVRESVVDKRCDVCVLLSGDADFLPAIEIIKELGCECISCSVIEGYSKELRSGDISLKLLNGVIY